MRIAYFDALGGAAGDMILGALLDAGLGFEQLRIELKKLPVEGYTLTQERVRKRGVAATQFRVQLDHAGHRHDHDLPRGPTLPDLEQGIASSGLEERVKDRARLIFRRLGEAEAKVRGLSPRQVRFDEVDVADTLVDIVAAAIAFDVLGVERVFCSPLPMTPGTVETPHGVLRLPSPLTRELVRRARAPVLDQGTPGGQVTPTGAAILTSVATFHRPPMTITRIGYGAGEADLDVPNVLRVSLGVMGDEL
ncbi:MAG: LarC family nickel insertion protein [Chloroflexi bacterium]|nr:LarC family nickel insertion protein [Chloroflexota bacterium]